MPEEDTARMINLSCPGCGAVFELPAELGGEVGECTECGTTFEIPMLEEIEHGDFEKTETGTIQVEEGDYEDTPTNTVKLSRSSIGMIPDVRSEFKLEKSRNTSRRSSFESRKNLRTELEEEGEEEEVEEIEAASPKNGTRSTKSFKKPPPKKKAPPPPDKPKKKWWQFFLFWK